MPSFFSSTPNDHIISYHLHLLRRHSPNAQQRRTTQHIEYYFKKKIKKNNKKILIEIKSCVKEESLEMFLEKICAYM